MRGTAEALPEVPTTGDLRALVLVGASAGGLGVLRRLLADLPADLPAALLAVVHRPAAPTPHVGDLVGQLAAVCALTVRQVGVAEPLRPGLVLVAAPDRHLEVVDGWARQSTAAPRHGARPSVDVLFDSAADAYGPRVVAVVLSGAMDDGAAGAAHVERTGGRVLVQDPADALLPGMPREAIATTHEHVVTTAGGLAPALVALVHAAGATA